MPDRRRYFARYIPVAVVLLLAGVLTISCYRCSSTPKPEPVLPAGVPIVRVLISRSVESVNVGTTGPYEIHADGSVVARSMSSLPKGKLSRRDGRWSLHAAKYTADELTIVAVGQSCVRVGSGLYRSRVVFSADAVRPGSPKSGGRMLAVNHLDMESYLTGVLAKELYKSWHIRTYEAQAIAARTYAFYEMGTFGQTHRYDLRSDQSSQVYGGFSAETDKARRAVETTRGIVMAIGPEGNERVFKAYYSSCCGGMTNSAYVLSGPPITSGPLAGGQKCDDCKASSRYRWPAVTVPKKIIFRALSKRYKQIADLGELKTIEVVAEAGQDESFGRAVWIDVVGTNGKKVRIRADDLRIALLRDGHTQGLYSMNCRIRDTGEAIVFDRGRGFGHGVGLCQWGAQGKAIRGCSVQEILQSYYPGAKFFRAY